jgi:predicted PurR-regulated permease PerM
VIAALHFGKELVIPLALAILLSFLLAYPATWLERLKLGRVLSVAVVLVTTFSAAGAIIWIGAQQFTEMVSGLPDYRQNIHRKLVKIGNPASSGLGRAVESASQIATDLSARSVIAKTQQTTVPAGQAQKPTSRAPVPVQVVNDMPDGMESLRLISTSIAQVAGTALVIVVLTLFILLRRNDLRNRLFRLFGERRISVMTTAIDDASKRVSQYLLTQSIVNGTFGLLLGVGLSALGVPYAAFWGAAAAAARFLPYVGAMTAGVCPFLLSVAVFDGWTKPLLTLGPFVTVEATTFGLLEPWFYATRTGISSLAVLISAAFWTVLWGPIGLVLSTPLTVLLFVLGRHVPQLQLLHILLGDQPALSSEAQYYQRLLAMDEGEARDVVEEYLKAKTRIELYDSVLIPALLLAEQDRHKERTG